MEYEELKERLKRIEFNKTEPETLIQLIDSAQRKGEKVQGELKKLRNLTEKIIETLNQKDYFKLNKNVIENKVVAIGIDGSNQLVGGIGGKWYCFWSVAMIIFKDGINSIPGVQVSAGIEEIDEQKNPNVMLEAEIGMLTAESKAILNWGSRGIESFVFIDGPIVDPPFSFHSDREYIKYRCRALKECIKNSIVIGCVKKVRDRFFIDIMKEDYGIKEVENFPTDQHLMLFLFKKLRQRNLVGSLYTPWFDLSKLDLAPYKEYKKEGIYVVTFFYEKEINSNILRIDVPFDFQPSENIALVELKIGKIINALDQWTYPGQDPLPILLAHEKCNIRKGAAEILYEEILTKSKSLDPLEQLITSKMR
ncbi:MAG: hypothetical protein RMJ17_00360 [Candidatus Aenigmarchaeota archaeon]|nr:DNA double-strand break repair nuclease NurA [Candidatus Aenigmarchaeota archaeon]MCX8158629.1 DNA double-strand break repair nuclease NurA [Candidatus Diapherotrites archaeon]MDW7999107.1 hypothetical protein [Thermodesulfovibrio sp.]MDW8149042.1 hypothetical protein [Candidatus Aenigmarchaeota archaeon]